MPTASLNFILDMYGENCDDIFVTFAEKGDVEDIIATEEDYIDLVTTLSKDEHVLAQILPLLSDDNSAEENNQIALLGLGAERDEHWVFIIDRLFPLSEPAFSNIDFRWLLSRLTPTRQHDIIYFMLADKRYISGYADIEAVVFANKIDRFYPLFIQGQDKFLSYNGRCAYSLLAEIGEVTSLFLLLKQEKDLFLRTRIAHWQLYAQDASALDFFFEQPVFLDDEGHHFTKFSSRQQLPLMKALLSERDDNKLIINMQELTWFGCAELIPLFARLLTHPNYQVVYQAHYAIAAFYSSYSDIGVAVAEISAKMEQQPAIKPQEIISFWQYIPKPESDVRYYEGEVFNLGRMIINNRMLPYREQLATFIYDVAIWSGQKFAFDPHAPYRKQFEQYNQMEQWFKHNPELCQSNKWLLFGQEILG